MNEKPTINPITLPPLTKFIYTLGQLPSSYLMSMTFEEQLVWLCNYLGTQVIPAINQNGDAVKELQSLYELLRSYVNNYFEDLDVQEEINNKLDEMASSGELTEIIAQYLGLAGMITFDTVADMKSAENLVNGSKCKTMGYYSINDGGGALYRARTITNDDTVDEMKIIALYDDSLIAELIEDEEMSILQLGAKGNNTDYDDNYFTTLFTLSSSILTIPNKTYKLQNKISISTSNKLIKCYGNINIVSTTTQDDSCFEISDSNNLTFEGFNISSTRDKTGYAPTGHTRESLLSSNRNGFKILKCENLNFINCTFNNMEYDIRMTKRNSDPDETILNKNIYINKMYSRNSSQSIYAQNIENLTINNADITSATNLGDGDHILYVSEYSKNIHFNNSIIKAGDKYLGILFNVRETHYNTESASPIDFYANNIISEGRGLVTAKSITKSYLSNVNFKMIDNSGDTSQRVINLIENAYLEADNCYFETTKYVFNHYNGTPKLIIKNSNIKGTGSTTLFVAQTAGNSDVIIKDSKIDNNYVLLDIFAGMQNCKFMMDNCIANTGNNYTFASRNPSGNNKVTILNSHITNSDSSATVNISYNGSGNDMTGYELLSTYFYGYTRVAGNTANSIVLNSYLNNTLIS